MRYSDILPMNEYATICIAHRISCLTGVAYMDVGEGRKQDAEALRIVAIEQAITPHRALPDTKCDALYRPFNWGFQDHAC